MERHWMWMAQLRIIAAKVTNLREHILAGQTAKRSNEETIRNKNNLHEWNTVTS